jgi:hypothetical protein
MDTPVEQKGLTLTGIDQLTLSAAAGVVRLRVEISRQAVGFARDAYRAAITERASLMARDQSLARQRERGERRLLVELREAMMTPWVWVGFVLAAVTTLLVLVASERMAAGGAGGPVGAVAGTSQAWWWVWIFGAAIVAGVISAVGVTLMVRDTQRWKRLATAAAESGPYFAGPGAIDLELSDAGLRFADGRHDLLLPWSSGAGPRLEIDSIGLVWLRAGEMTVAGWSSTVHPSIDHAIYWAMLLGLRGHCHARGETMGHLLGRMARQHSLRCIKCGYDLSGTEATRCSECGHDVRLWDIPLAALMQTLREDKADVMGSRGVGGGAKSGTQA